MKLTPSEWQKRLGFEVLDPDGWDRRAEYFQADWNKELTFDEFMDKAELSTCSRHPSRAKLFEKLFASVNKVNNFHLRVYKLNNVTTESSSGICVNIRMVEIWDAPFNDETSLIKALLDFTGRGFYCRAEKS